MNLHRKDKTNLDEIKSKKVNKEHSEYDNYMRIKNTNNLDILRLLENLKKDSKI